MGINFDLKVIKIGLLITLLSLLFGIGLGIVFGAKDPKRGYSLINQNLLHPKTVVTSGIMEKECAALIKNFFKTKR